jgi:hypothetical protein
MMDALHQTDFRLSAVRTSALIAFCRVVTISHASRETPPLGEPTAYIGVDRNTTKHIAATVLSAGKVLKLGKAVYIPEIPRISVGGFKIKANTAPSRKLRTERAALSRTLTTPFQGS